MPALMAAIGSGTLLAKETNRLPSNTQSGPLWAIYECTNCGSPANSRLKSRGFSDGPARQTDNRRAVTLNCLRVTRLHH